VEREASIRRLCIVCSAKFQRSSMMCLWRFVRCFELYSLSLLQLYSLLAVLESCVCEGCVCVCVCVCVCAV
jgi:hypothetical protein